MRDKRGEGRGESIENITKEILTENFLKSQQTQEMNSKLDTYKESHI